MAATRIVALFNLKPGVAVADYEAWARTVDLPTVKGLGSIAGFEVFKATHLLGSDAAPPYAYIEILDVLDMGRFGEDVATPLMQAVARDFGAMVDVSFSVVENIDPKPGA